MAANPKLPAEISAKRINEQHRLAKESAETAIEHAVLCGELLAEQKSRLKHGEFQEWIEKHCDFAYSTASRYMTAAKQISTGVEFSSLSHLFPSGKKPKPAAQISTAVEISTQAKPAVMEAARAVHIPTKTEALQPAAEPVAAVPPPNDFDFTDYEPEDEDAFRSNIENVLMADDKLAAMVEELKKLHRELQVMKESRDHYQNQAGQAARIVKQRDREIEKLKKQLESRKGQA